MELEKFQKKRISINKDTGGKGSEGSINQTNLFLNISLRCTRYKKTG